MFVIKSLITELRGTVEQFLVKYYSLNEKLMTVFNDSRYEVCSKIRGMFELRDSSWFSENPLGVARFVRIS